MKFSRDDAMIAAGVGLMCLTAFVVYWPAVHGEFIWDDFINILNNPLMRADTGLADIWLAQGHVRLLPADVDHVVARVGAPGAARRPATTC